MKKQFERSNNTTKPKMVTTFYEKTFESFNDMISELKSLHPEFNIIFTYDETTNPKDASCDLIKYFSNNLPDIVNRANLPMSINISSNRASLKTNKFFTIEWSFKYDRNGFVTDLVATIITFTKEYNDAELVTLIENIELENSGWNKVVKNFNRK